MTGTSPENRMVVARIQNKRDPAQLIELMWDQAGAILETVGLKELYGVKEIRIRADNPLEVLEQYAEVLSFLFETMSEAQRIHLPYYYQDHFEFEGRRFSLGDQGDHRLLEEVMVA